MIVISDKLGPNIPNEAQNICLECSVGVPPALVVVDKCHAFTRKKNIEWVEVPRLSALLIQSPWPAGSKVQLVV